MWHSIARLLRALISLRALVARGVGAMVITRSNRGACDDAFRSALYTCAILNWRLASRCIADPSRCIAPRPPAESQPTAVLSTLCQQLEHVLASKANPTTKRDCLRSKPVRARRQIVQLQFAITSPNRMCLGAVREASDLSLLSMFVWRRVQVPYRPSLVRTCIGNCRTDNSSSSCAGFELSVLALKLQRRGVLFALPRLTRVPLHVSVSYGWRILLLTRRVEPKSDGDRAHWRLCGGYKIVHQ